MNHTGVWLTGSRRQAARKVLIPLRLAAASPDLSVVRGTVTHVTERLCKDCEGLLTLAPHDDDSPVPDLWDDELMCVICGAATSMGGPLYGELAAMEDVDAA